MAKAKQLLAAAGLPNGYAFELTIVNDPQQRRFGEVIQGMAREAGFNITLRPSEFASALTDDDNGKLQAFAIGWSGRVDPDGNIHQFQTCGGSLNTTLVCDEAVDALLNKAREVSDQGAAREALPRGHRQDHRAAQRHLSLPPQLHRRVSQEPEGLPGGARRADPHQGGVLELSEPRCSTS